MFYKITITILQKRKTQGTLTKKFILGSRYLKTEIQMKLLGKERYGGEANIETIQ